MLVGMVVLTRETGQRAWIRCDEVASFFENSCKNAEKESVPCITVQLRNNVSMNFPGITGEDFVKGLASAGATQFHAQKLEQA
jgi:hypothetical protein